MISEVFFFWPALNNRSDGGWLTTRLAPLSRIIEFGVLCDHVQRPPFAERQAGSGPCITQLIMQAGGAAALEQSRDQRAAAQQSRWAVTEQGWTGSKKEHGHFWQRPAPLTACYSPILCSIILNMDLMGCRSLKKTKENDKNNSICEKTMTLASEDCWPTVKMPCMPDY